jgi:hypothetical protein
MNDDERNLVFVVFVFKKGKKHRSVEFFCFLLTHHMKMNMKKQTILLTILSHTLAQQNAEDPAYINSVVSELRANTQFESLINQLNTASDLQQAGSLYTENLNQANTIVPGAGSLIAAQGAGVSVGAAAGATNGGASQATEEGPAVGAAAAASASASGPNAAQTAITTAVTGSDGGVTAMASAMASAGGSFQSENSSPAAGDSATSPAEGASAGATGSAAEGSGATTGTGSA